MAVRFRSLQGDGIVSLDVKEANHKDIQAALDRADARARSGKWTESANILYDLGNRFMGDGDPEAAAYTYRRLLQVLRGKWSPEGGQFSIKRPDVEVLMRDANAGRISLMPESDADAMVQIGRRFPVSFLWLASKRPGEFHDAIDLATVAVDESRRVFFGAVFRKALHYQYVGLISGEIGLVQRVIVPHKGIKYFEQEIEPVARPALPPIETAAGLPPYVIAGIYGVLMTSLPQSLMPAVGVPALSLAG